MDEYNKNVFINCPYDSQYKGLLDAMLFVVVVLGFNPRLALESSDSGQIRLDKIVNLIHHSKYSIHDLSRVVSTRKGEYFRLNMPLELGIDYACRCFDKQCGDKLFLILEREPFSSQKAISDLSGVDLKAHCSNGAAIIKCVRNWFVETAGLRSIPSPEKLFSDYIDSFQVFLLNEAKKLGYSAKNYTNNITVVEYIDYIRKWKVSNPTYSKIIPFKSEIMPGGKAGEAINA